MPRRGRGLAQKLTGLNLRGSSPSPSEQPEKALDVEHDEAGNPWRPKAKSPTKSMAAEPYPSATGPGGLLSMLKSLRQIRDQNGNVQDISMDTTECPAINSTVNTTAVIDETFYSCRKEINGEAVMNASNVNNDNNFVDANELEKKIIRQVEYYFGDYNLPKDKWMLKKLEECDQGWFDMETMMTFPRLRSLSQDPSVVLMALAKSPHDILQIENWGDGKGRVRRNPEHPIPEINEARRISIQERTLFVWGFDKTTTSLDDLIGYFENNFRNVVNIRQRTVPVRCDGEEQEEKDLPNGKREFLGSVFVTFGSKSDANDFFKDQRLNRLTFKGRKLKAKWQRDFLNDRAEFNDELDEAALDRTIYVSGFDKLDTSKEELMHFFKGFEGPIALRKRVFRFGSSDNEWQFTGGVFVTFDTPDNAQKFISRDSLSFNGDALQVSWQREFFKSKGLFKAKLT